MKWSLCLYDHELPAPSPPAHELRGSSSVTADAQPPDPILIPRLASDRIAPLAPALLTPAVVPPTCCPSASHIADTGAVQNQLGPSSPRAAAVRLVLRRRRIQARPGPGGGDAEPVQPTRSDAPRIRTHRAQRRHLCRLAVRQLVVPAIWRSERLSRDGKTLHRVTRQPQGGTGVVSHHLLLLAQHDEPYSDEHAQSVLLCAGRDWSRWECESFSLT